MTGFLTLVTGLGLSRLITVSGHMTRVTAVVTLLSRLTVTTGRTITAQVARFTTVVTRS
jgi:hypothetical protein